MIEGASRIYDSKDGMQAMGELGNTVMLSDVNTGGKILQVSPDDDVEGIASSSKHVLTGLKFGEGTLLCAYGTDISCIDCAGVAVLWELDLLDAHPNCNVLYLAGSREFVLLSQTAEKGGDDYAKIRTSLTFIDELSGSLVQTVAFNGLPATNNAKIAVSDDESTFAVAVGEDKSGNAYLALFQRSDDQAGQPQVLQTNLAQRHVSDLDFDGNKLIATSFAKQYESDVSNAAYELFDATFDEAYPVFSEEGFEGFAAWSYSTQRMRVYALNDSRKLEGLDQLEDVSYGLTGDTVLASCVDGSLRLIDPTSFMERCRVPVDSLGLASAKGLRVILPEMLECGRRANGDGVATLIYRMKAPVKGTGLAVFRLDADNFGPVSDVRYGLYLSKDGKKVLCNEPWMDSYVAYPRYDLADMIRQADRIIDDFDFKEG